MVCNIKFIKYRENKLRVTNYVQVARNNSLSSLSEVPCLQADDVTN